jgi:hypothetical protein
MKAWAWLEKYWQEALIFKVLISVASGAIWYLFPLNIADYMAISGIFCLAAATALWAKKEIQESGPAVSPVLVLKFLAISALAILLNSMTFIFSNEKLWADIVGSNCFILIALLIIPTIFIDMAAYGEREETDFDLNYS